MNTIVFCAQQIDSFYFMFLIDVLRALLSIPIQSYDSLKLLTIVHIVVLCMCVCVCVCVYSMCVCDIYFVHEYIQFVLSVWMCVV